MLTHSLIEKNRDEEGKKQNFCVGLKIITDFEYQHNRLCKSVSFLSLC